MNVQQILLIALLGISSYTSLVKGDDSQSMSTEEPGAIPEKLSTNISQFFSDYLRLGQYNIGKYLVPSPQTIQKVKKTIAPAAAGINLAFDTARLATDFVQLGRQPSKYFAGLKAIEQITRKVVEPEPGEAPEKEMQEPGTPEPTVLAKQTTVKKDLERATEPTESPTTTQQPLPEKLPLRRTLSTIPEERLLQLLQRWELNELELLAPEKRSTEQIDRLALLQSIWPEMKPADIAMATAKLRLLSLDPDLTDALNQIKNKPTAQRTQQQQEIYDTYWKFEGKFKQHRTQQEQKRTAEKKKEERRRRTTQQPAIVVSDVRQHTPVPTKMNVITEKPSQPLPTPEEPKLTAKTIIEPPTTNTVLSLPQSMVPIEESPKIPVMPEVSMSPQREEQQKPTLEPNIAEEANAEGEIPPPPPPPMPMVEDQEAPKSPVSLADLLHGSATLKKSSTHKEERLEKGRAELLLELLHKNKADLSFVEQLKISKRGLGVEFRRLPQLENPATVIALRTKDQKTLTREEDAVLRLLAVVAEREKQNDETTEQTEDRILNELIQEKEAAQQKQLAETKQRALDQKAREQAVAALEIKKKEAAQRKKENDLKKMEEELLAVNIDARSIYEERHNQWQQEHAAHIAEQEAANKLQEQPQQASSEGDGEISPPPPPPMPVDEPKEPTLVAVLKELYQKQFKRSSAVVAPKEPLILKGSEAEQLKTLLEFEKMQALQAQQKKRQAQENDLSADQQKELVDLAKIYSNKALTPNGELRLISLQAEDFSRSWIDEAAAKLREAKTDEDKKVRQHEVDAREAVLELMKKRVPMYTIKLKPVPRN